MRSRLLFVVIAVASFVFDRAAKLWVRQDLLVGERLNLYGDTVALHHVHNRGVAFGMLAGMSGIVVIGSLIVGVLLFTFLLRVDPADWITTVGGALITGGALGNLVDRIEQGYVTDYISVASFPTFNVADVCITIGVCFVLFGQLRLARAEQTAEQAQENERP